MLPPPAFSISGTAYFAACVLQQPRLRNAKAMAQHLAHVELIVTYKIVTFDAYAERVVPAVLVQIHC